MKLKKSGFTLVELIIVITILAVLATIGLLSFRGYSADARNSKRAQDVDNIKSTITSAIAQGGNVLSYAITGSYGNQISTMSLRGTGAIIAPTASYIYDAGALNYETAGIKESEFSDPSDAVPYSVGVTSANSGRFEVAASMEGSNGRYALLTGSYSPRTNTSIAATCAASTARCVITAPTNANKVKVGDYINITGPSVNRTVSAVSVDGLTITLNSAITGTPGTAIALFASETAGLIGEAAAATDVVTNNGTDLPY